MAALLNIFLPGAGHLILAKPFQALIWFVLVVGGYFFIVPGLIFHLLCVVDAARQAKRDQITAIEKGMARAMKAKR